MCKGRGRGRQGAGRQARAVRAVRKGKAKMAGRKKKGDRKATGIQGQLC